MRLIPACVNGVDNRRLNVSKLFRKFSRDRRLHKGCYVKRLEL